MKILKGDYLKSGINNNDIAKDASVAAGIPAADGFFMPGEFEPHAGCIMIWPDRPGSWIYGAGAARRAFADVIAAIAKSEKVYVAAGKSCLASALETIFEGKTKPGEWEGTFVWDETADSKDKEENNHPAVSAKEAADTDGVPDGEIRHTGSLWRRNVEIFTAETDDAWARDIAPTFVVKQSRREDAPKGNTPLRGEDAASPDKSARLVRAVNWEFNAWGGAVDGLYASWEKDNAFAKYFCEKYGYEVYDAAPFVLEGGSVHSDGEGTVLVTAACLLSAGRNPSLTKEQIEERLKRYLGAKKVLWLPGGIYQDETNEHVDNVCAFLRPGEVVLAWTDNEDDPQYPLSAACLDYLARETDARGRKLAVHKLPIPDVPICITDEELKGYRFEEGEDVREAGERLAASYVNFYFSNNAVVMPVFGGENEESDRRAVALMEQWNHGRKVVPVAARDILVGGGNIHCITQQIPAGKPQGNEARQSRDNRSMRDREEENEQYKSSGNSDALCKVTGRKFKKCGSEGAQSGVGGRGHHPAPGTF